MIPAHPLSPFPYGERQATQCSGSGSVTSWVILKQAIFRVSHPYLPFLQDTYYGLSQITYMKESVNYKALCRCKILEKVS